MTAIATAIDPCRLVNRLRGRWPGLRSGANSCAPACQFVHEFPDSCTPFPVRHSGAFGRLHTERWLLEPFKRENILNSTGERAP